MTITSKFNYDQEVWRMYKNKPAQMKVEGLRIKREMRKDCNIHDISYGFETLETNTSPSFKYTEWLQEDQVFLTKDELLASL